MKVSGEKIEEKDIKEINKNKTKIANYKDLYNNEDTNEEVIIIYQIPLRYDKYESNLTYTYDKKNINTKNIKELYFKIDKIDEEFKNKFCIKKKKTTPNHTHETSASRVKKMKGTQPNINAGIEISIIALEKLIIIQILKKKMLKIIYFLIKLKK